MEIHKAKGKSRFRVAILGRRSGKTTLAIEDIIDSCWSNPRPKEWPIAYIAPTYKQAKRITWERFKQHFAPNEAKYNVSELTITHVPTGSKIYLLGCDTNADSLRGVGLWHSVVDEIKDISGKFLEEVLRPCFSDSGAGCLYIGTPGPTKGNDYLLFCRGQKLDNPDWRAWTATSEQAGIISAEEIALAKAEMGPESFAREYGAAFSFRQGLVVKHFSSENIQPVELEHDHRVHISCDFNVDPCMWVLAHRLPPRYHFFDEIVKENTTINEMCDDFARRYPPERVSGITINGDASGNNRNVNTDRKNETSYTIMRNRLAELGYSDVRIAVRPKNPGVQDRIEAFNAKVMNANGEAFVYVNPRCKWLIYNLENLRWVEGTSDIWEPTTREIREDPKLKFTKHIYDAASYLVEYYDPIRNKPVTDAPAIWAPDLELGI